MAHDLGHTPFGHTGEEVLNRLMKGKGGFEHNLQSFRVVDELEERYPGFNGLNLTWELREGIIKHASPYDTPTEVMAGFLPGVVPSIEGQIINYADEIAYNNHDIDDGLKSGYITLDMLERITLWQRVSSGVREKYPAIDDRRLVFQTISALIGLLIGDICATITANLEHLSIASLDDLRRVNRPVAHFSDEITLLNLELKRFLFEQPLPPLQGGQDAGQGRDLHHPPLRDLPPVPQPAAAQVPFSAVERFGLERTVCDYIAGMTDRFALDEYKRLFEPYERV